MPMRSASGRSTDVGNLRAIFAGGGTGGHLFPAVAIADELRRMEPTAVILFVGIRRCPLAVAIMNGGHEQYLGVIPAAMPAYALSVPVGRCCFESVRRYEDPRLTADGVW